MVKRFLYPDIYIRLQVRMELLLIFVGYKQNHTFGLCNIHLCFQNWQYPCQNILFEE